MQEVTTKPLIKNKLFLIVLIMAIACSLTSLTLFFYMMGNLDSCLGWNACSEESSGYYYFCVRDGYKFCCGGWGGDHESCGEYQNNCRRKGDGYIDCGPVFKAEMAFNIIAVCLAAVLVILACLHRRQAQINAQENYSLVAQNRP
jgi:hypothetical protein